jgi:beta-galactosidase
LTDLLLFDRRSLSLPHDFVVEGNFSEAADKSHGYLPFGVGYYRKHMSPLPNATAALVAAGTHEVYLMFDGAQTMSTVFFDGNLLGSHASG